MGLTKGSWSADDTVENSELAPANKHRQEISIEFYSGNKVFLAAGENPVVNEGVTLESTGSIITFTGALARKSIYGICADTNSASGGWQEG